MEVKTDEDGHGCGYRGVGRDENADGNRDGMKMEAEMKTERMGDAMEMKMETKVEMGNGDEDRRLRWEQIQGCRKGGEWRWKQGWDGDGRQGWE